MKRSPHRAATLVLSTLTVAAWSGAALAQATPAAPAPAAPAPAAPAPAAPAPATAAPAAPAAPEPAPAAAAAPAAPKFPVTTIGGYVEGAYHRALVSSFPSPILPLRAYDSANGFQLHAAHFALKHQATEHVTGVIEFDAGADAAVNNFSIFSPGSRQLFDVQEAYAVYSNNGLTFTAGKFATYEGIEVIEGPSNPTVTRGYLYYLAEPVTHVGAKIHYATGPIDVGVGVVNGWDTNGQPPSATAPVSFFTADNNSAKTGIFRIGVTPVPQFWAAVSGTYGVEKVGIDEDPRLSIDLTGAIIPSDTITINFQANLGSEKKAGLPDAAGAATDASWFGFGIQPLLKFGAGSVGARFEYFKDTKGSRTLVANDPSYTNITITPGYTFDGAFTLRGEFRYDTASEEVLGMPGDLKKSQSSIALAAHYTF